jgi:hypothetical protein
MLDGKTMFIRIDTRNEKIDDEESGARFTAERAS